MTIIRDQHFVFSAFHLVISNVILYFFNFEFVTLKRNSKSLTIDLVTRSLFFYFFTSS